jgi:hypothetical protein
MKSVALKASGLLLGFGLLSSANGVVTPTYLGWNLDATFTGKARAVE